MKERPILMSAPMVRAVLAGTKTQTRRVVKPQPPAGWNRNCWFSAPVWGWTAEIEPSKTWHKVRCPYGQPGDRLWVREAWRTTGDSGRADYLPPRDVQPHPIWYEADGPAPADQCVGKLRPGMFMPRWASRITLEVTGVRVERLQDISDADALAEGVDRTNTSIPGYARQRFEKLWESINGPGSWEANPWVWCVSFRRLP